MVKLEIVTFKIKDAVDKTTFKSHIFAKVFRQKLLYESLITLMKEFFCHYLFI